VTTLEIKDGNRILTPWNKTLGIILFSELRNPDLFSQSFGNPGFAIH
jgi:hypothetical protein